MVNEQKHLAILVVASVLLGVTVMTILTITGTKDRASGGYTGYLPAAMFAGAAEPNPWMRAAEKVKEDRDEPAGKQAKVEIPSELRHYSDTRRFLATQVAEVREQSLRTPRDLVDLARMIEGGEMVALPSVTKDYILFGVGGNASKGAFTRYEANQSVSLFDEAGLSQEYARLAVAQTKLQNEIVDLRKQLGSLTRRERSKRGVLQAQIPKTQKMLKTEVENKQVLDRYYGDAERRAKLFSDHALMQGLAKSFRGRAYDISDSTDRRAMKVALLSSLRPEALEVLEEIASAYREKFDRPLPITSLVRPDEYQYQLSKVNPNATRIQTPPHSTGLAFDIMYRYMTAAEQSFLMAELAQLKDDGRIEVLRENRDHYHVFAFIDGARPNDKLIAASMGLGRAPKAAKAVVSHHAKNKSAKSKAKPQRARRAVARSTGKRRR
jgi:hypothetical protein